MKRVLLAIIAIGFCLSMKANTDSIPAPKPFPQAAVIEQKLEMAEEYWDKGNFKKAESILLDAYKICKRYLPDSYWEYTDVMGELLELYVEYEKIEKAEKLLRENLRICEDKLGYEEYMEATFMLEEFYEEIGNLKKAKQYSLLPIDKDEEEEEEELDEFGKFEKYAHAGAVLMNYLQEVAAEEGSASTAVFASYAGMSYLGIGDWKRAEEKLLEAVKLYEDYSVQHPNEPVSKEDSAQYELSYTMLGALYMYTGDYPLSEKYFLRSTEITKERTGEGPEYENSLTRLGLLYKQTGDYSKAEPFLTRALKGCADLYGMETRNYAIMLNHLGGLYLDMHDYSQAEHYLTEADQLYNQLNQKEDLPLMASCMDNLGQIYAHKKDYTNAIEKFIKAGLIHGYWFGMNHPYFISTLCHLGETYYEAHKYPDAAHSCKQARDAQKKAFIHSVDFMTEQQRSRYWETIKDRYERLYPNLSYRYYAQNKEISTFAYDNELYTKGLLLTSSNAVRQSIMDSKDSTLIQDWERLMNLQNRLTLMQQNGSKVDSLTLVEQYSEQLEKKLTKASAEYRENMRQWNITWDSVRAVLKPNQVAIEYMRAPLNEDSTMYCALLLRHDSKYPELIPLFEEKQVAKLLHTSTGDSTAINTTYLYHQHGAKLSQHIWGPIEKYIQEGEQVFIAPTHMLHQIAIENLPYDSTLTMSDVYQIARLSSTRELVLPKKPIPHKMAALYGGILYDTLSTDMMWYNRQTFAKRDMTAADSKDSQRKIKGCKAKPLYATQDEVDAIAPILKSQKIAVTIYSHYSACEESVKALSGQKQNILHFATHGMYIDTLSTNDPLERCLLAFAGANRALRGDSVPEGNDDGILTAKEISVLDFRDADIVVLSACETGLGDVSGEGVFGLQRAFKMAGAQTILMALWQVHDDATQMLMTAFYRHYNSKKVSKREAFRLAQKEVREYTETETIPVVISPTPEEQMKSMGKDLEPRIEYKTVTTRPYASPYYWAGFILLD